MKTTLKVTGMHCEGCENKIQKVVGRIDSVHSVTADRTEEMVELDLDESPELLTTIKTRITDLGYTVVD
ncbi:MAG TPA: heavy-metal-associated domain-containing protein [bacterium]|nr:heavy-metal-associated domain-containing protein [bacterium]